MKLSIVVPVWNRGELVLACLRSIRRSLQEFDGACEVIVVDDCSTDDSCARVAEEFADFQLLRNKRNLGFAVSANRGLRVAQGEYLLLLNSDTELPPGALRSLVALLDEDPRREVVAPRLCDREGNTQKSCMAWPELSTAFFFSTPMERWCPDSAEMERYFLRDFDHESARDDVQPPASCWLMRHSAWQRVGEFDEDLELFFNDVDWARRLRQMGGKLHYCPEVSVLHVGGASTSGRADFVKRWQTDRLRYYRKHFPRLGALVVKSCVAWSYADWWLRQPSAQEDQEPSGESESLRRDLLHFLWEE